MTKAQCVRRAALLAAILGSACSRHDEGRDTTPSAALPALDPPLAYETRAYQAVKAEVEVLEARVAREPKVARHRLELARTLLAGGIAGRAGAELEKVLELKPDSVDAALRLGRLRLAAGDLDAAQAALERVAARDASAAAIVLEVEIELARRGGDETSNARIEPRLRQALAIDPNDAQAAYLLAVRVAERGDAASAAALLEHVRRVDPSHLGAHHHLARLLRMLGREDEAEVVARAHRRLSMLDQLGILATPESVEAYVGVAQLLATGGDRTGALAEIEAGVARHPGAPLLRVKLALLRIQEGDRDGGRREFEVALRDLGEDPMILNQFAWYLATQGGEDDRRRAVKLAERAVAASQRRDKEILDTLAEARSAVGDHAGAMAAIDEARRLDPSDATLERRRVELERRGGGRR
jgi:Tfp pilus assembly protein PilF